MVLPESEKIQPPLLDVPRIPLIPPIKMDSPKQMETAARRAFENDLIRSEIAANIFYQTTALDCTDRVDLKRFALTSRSGCETALRFLWRHVTLQEINHIHRVKCDPVSNIDRETISA